MGDLVETCRLYMTKELYLEFRRWHMFVVGAALGFAIFS